MTINGCLSEHFETFALRPVVQVVTVSHMLTRVVDFEGGFVVG
jgi:hypothetical protein